MYYFVNKKPLLPIIKNYEENKMAALEFLYNQPEDKDIYVFFQVQDLITSIYYKRNFEIYEFTNDKELLVDHRFKKGYDENIFEIIKNRKKFIEVFNDSDPFSSDEEEPPKSVEQKKQDVNKILEVIFNKNKDYSSDFISDLDSNKKDKTISTLSSVERIRTNANADHEDSDFDNLIVEFSKKFKKSKK